MTTDHLPQQLDLDFGSCHDVNFQACEEVVPTPPVSHCSADVILLENYFRNRQEQKNVILYENIFDSIKHIG